MTCTAIGLMSGSSLDGLDIAACVFDFDQEKIVKWILLAGETTPFPESWQHRLRMLPQAGALEMAKAHAELGHWMGDAVHNFLECYPGLKPDLIASHGHTLFHFPSEKFTAQIGDGAAIAARTGYTTVCDFRSADMALGGQGAPLAPIADRMLFSSYDLMLNIGGIANLTCNILGQRFIAFDIGGANQILNALSQEIGLPFDNEGQLASKGKVIPALMEAMNKLPFFETAPPKSLGNDWVQSQQTDVFLAWDAPLEDRLYTACELLAHQTALALDRIIEQENWALPAYRMLVTGGGAFNTFLTQKIMEACRHHANIILDLPNPDIIAFKEAVLMALMGAMRLKLLPNCLSSVTGASRNAVGGAVYAGWRL
jgi:anhydro-N-acetylmuramic acid kinase